MIINEFAESRTEEKNMEEKQIQIPDVNAGAKGRDNYTLIQETPEDNLSAAYGRCGIQRKSPADQLLEMDGDAFRFVFAAQPPEVLRPLDECQHLLARSHKKVRPLVLNAPRRSPGSAYSSCLPRLSKKRVSTMPTLWSATMCSHVL